MSRRPSTEDGTSPVPGHLGVTVGARGDLFDPQCPTRSLLDRIGTKWVVMIMAVLSDHGAELRFAELVRRAPGISRKMLSQTLAGLVADGLVSRRVESTVPPAVHYGLTDLGRSLAEVLAHVRNWAETHMLEIDRHRGHHSADRV